MRTRRHRHEYGSAVVELSLVSVALIPALLYAFYFFDVLHLRLKVQEAARYGAWEFTGHNLHDYAGSGSSGHQAKFDSPQGTIQSDIEERFKNLVSLDTEEKETHPALAIDWEFQTAEITVGDAPMASDSISDVFNNNNTGGGFGNVVGLFNMGIDAALKNMNYNVQGQVTSEVTIQATATIFPDHYFEGHWGMGDPLLPRNLQQLDYTESVTLIADSWKLHDGADYVEGESGTQNERYKTQVSNTAWFGLGSMGGIGDACQRMLDAGIAVPCGSVLRSKNYEGGSDSGMYGFSSGGMNPQIDGGVDRYHTTPMDDGSGSSEYERTFDKRGGYYMGCTEAAAEDCSW